MGWRRGGSAMLQPAAGPAATRPRRLLRSLGAVTLGPPQPRPNVLELLLDALGCGVELQGLLPGRGRVLVEAALDERVAEVLEDHGIFLGAVDGALELVHRFAVAALLIVGPAEAVDEVAVLGLQRQSLVDERDGLVEVLTALGVHVADVVVGLGVLGIERDDVTELADRVLELLLLL